MAHHGWLTRSDADPCHMDEVADLAVFPELRWLDRNAWVPIVSTAVGLFFLGILLGRVAPWTGTNGPQLLIWAFFINTVVLWHVTFAVNSVCHRWGKRHHNTKDDSRSDGGLPMAVKLDQSLIVVKLSRLIENSATRIRYLQLRMIFADSPSGGKVLRS